ncbi:hypothetical protein REC12_04590 [Desulfosporosinus sp. PR]|uniref:hypothetical protein n=1 Tax=Candidatus Desulfosporosinus nitrosoreducens TaxID=3401928 RepID=UPI0027FC9383|nr:hypothetical protein [Desulfosporosinus sp. PR]MDQ7092859.1 hypothetical protein [Desulfosporosinus sp. PR]
MFKIMPQLRKVWIFGAAAAIIIASSSTMAYALNNNIPENASSKVVSSATASKEAQQSQSSNINGTAEYSVVDLSTSAPSAERTKALKDKLSLIKGITPEQIEEKYKAIIAATIPGEKDISANQAAAYAAAILKKAYGVDFKGYTAEASFSRNSVPNSDNWTVIFHAPQEDKNSKRYLASVNSVNGTMLDANMYDLAYAPENSQNLQDPAWKNTAEEDITKLLPENVSITGSKVVAATPETGVTVVGNLSDGSAFAVRLTGENKEAAAYQYFPNGYDGSWDYHPVTGNGVG